jgi:hypothetical protein
MKRLYALLEAARQLEDELDELVLDAVVTKEPEILSLNTDQQLYNKGVDRNNIKIAPPYTAAWVKHKKKKGDPHDRVTLRDTGEFHDSFFISTVKGGFFIDSTDEKAGWLNNRYFDIFGLTPQNVLRVCDEIRPPLIAAVRAKLAV